MGPWAVRGSITALLVLGLVLAESFAWAGNRWGTVALGGGLALALVLRWRRPAVWGAAVGLALGQFAIYTPPVLAVASTLAMLLAISLGVRVLQRLGFDSHLRRTPDLVHLVLVVLILAAPVASLPLLVWSRGLPGLDELGAVALRMLSLALGMLMATLPGLLLDSRQRAALPHARQLGVAVALGLATLACALLPLTPLLHESPWAAVWLLVPHALLLALVAQSGTAGAAATLAVLAVLMPAVAAAMGILPTDAQGNTSSRFVAWVIAPLCSMLLLLLVAHTLRAASTWRENRWEWALDGSRLGVADWHLHGAESFASEAWSRLTGHARGRWSPQLWMQQVHPDDRQALAAAIAGVSAGDDGSRQLELRSPSGEHWRWLEATLLVVERDPLGQPTRLMATVSDIEERHEAQQRQRLSVSLFQHLHEGLLIADESLHVIDVNPAYVQILGFSRDELVGQVPSLLRLNPADPLARQQRSTMWAAVGSTGSWRGELLERRRSGELCTLQATLSTVPGPSQNLHFHVLVISDITEQRVQRERLERQAHFDELTRLPNRARLSELLSEAMFAADRDGYLLAVCYLDLDHFKPVNDRWGHAAGDRLLAELAGRLRSALRSRETWADAAARLGGDEFVLLLRAGTLEEARLAVERVLRVVSQPYVVDAAAEPVQVTASMGATVYPIDRSDADTLLRHADHAMYGAKQSGRNGYLFFDPEHRRRTEERVMAIGRVQEALDQSEFVLFYQPKVDMRHGTVLGFEALLRWEHPQQGLIAPLQFLPLIENTGLSSRIGDWVLAQALEHLAIWRKSGMDISVGVNISARHLQEPDFAQRLSELLARHPEPLATHLELEMLETAAHADIDATSSLLARCRALGVRFALDDFGTGYSTLTYLKRLPVDTLKIDRSFVHHMLDDNQDRAIVEGVIGLARTFGCLVIAEGVESPAQARTLMELGCDHGQGTGIAAPMPASQVTGWVRDYRGMFALTPASAAAAAARLPG